MKQQKIFLPNNLETLKDDAKNFIGQIVHIEAWSKISNSMQLLYPNDEIMAWIEELAMNVPESDLVNVEIGLAMLKKQNDKLLHAIEIALDDLWKFHGNGFGTQYEKPIAVLQAAIENAKV